MKLNLYLLLSLVWSFAFVSKHPKYATVDQSSITMVADRHRLAAYHHKHCWRAFWGYQHRWPRTTLNPKI